MLGLPNQTPDSVRRSIKVLAGFDVQHVSAYMLKIEPRTPFAYTAKNLPDETLVSQIYLAAAEALEKNGFAQYEISNFAKNGFECKHNLKYWTSGEFLGIGAAAHSFYDGERFCVSPDIRQFIKASKQEIVIAPKPDTTEKSFEEYAMLRLRLTEGLSFAECEKYGVKKAEMLKRCKLVPPDYLNITGKGISITKEGFMVSNRIIVKLTTAPAEQMVE
jgi:oxygen-independent coproporphyrinogen-3 oxidase